MRWHLVCTLAVLVVGCGDNLSPQARPDARVRGDARATDGSDVTGDDAMPTTTSVASTSRCPRRAAC